MQDKVCVYCVVSGLVQGVWYRASTQEQAKKLNLTGWVRNLPDGRVEVMACGEKDKVLEMQEWRKEGPPRAKVSDVTYEEVDWKDDLHEFQVLGPGKVTR
jgi:acylphosphatase